MKPRTSFFIFLFALVLAPFAPSIRAIYQRVAQELEATYAKAAAASNVGPGFPLAAIPLSVTAAVQPTVAEAAPIRPVLSPDAPNTPAQLAIPSIGLDVAIGSVGLTPTGNMGVLNDPAKVSWYKNGTAPGNRGSAVIGAHVFQSFAKLKDVKLGDSIYVERSDGSRLRFVVSEIEVYPYTATAPLPKIFNRSDKARLNLITCSGMLTADHSTYDHRLVVFAELAR